ncbi:MAG TPA: permease prefix domain 1-containing protein [Candidatus Acidoferrales bacterium]|jgi:hypothetical protein|nr:permease prefix domain 1-containing protein [Candidatus Acidoferrales bacterium]
MFNLESSIANWRRQMLAAGIQSPVPLEELENHLREEINQQIRAGLNEHQAFESAYAQIGRADRLKTEFKKSEGVLVWLSATPQCRIIRILALLWLARCLWGLVSTADIIGNLPYAENVQTWFFGISMTRTNSILLIMLTGGLIYVMGIVASLRLLAGKGGTWPILFLAVLGLVVFVVSINSFTNDFPMFGWFARYMLIFNTILNVVTLWLLWPRQKAKHALE